MSEIRATVIRPMPAFYAIAHAVWGEATEFDSDGDSDDVESTIWRELTLTRRPDYDLRVDIDPTPEDRDTIVIRSDSLNLVYQVLDYLEHCGSVVRNAS